MAQLVTPSCGNRFRKRGRSRSDSFRFVCWVKRPSPCFVEDRLAIWRGMQGLSSLGSCDDATRARSALRNDRDRVRPWPFRSKSRSSNVTRDAGQLGRRRPGRGGKRALALAVKRESLFAGMPCPVVASWSVRAVGAPDRRRNARRWASRPRIHDYEYTP
jgi:hypothetical protein